MGEREERKGYFLLEFFFLDGNPEASNNMIYKYIVFVTLLLRKDKWQ